MAGVVEPRSANPILAVEGVQTVPELGALLRRLRRRQARRQNTSVLTVRELARRSGYAYGAISEYLSGKALAPTERFDVLIRLLGASPAEQRALATARDRVEELRRAQRPAPGAPRELPPDVYGFTGRRHELAELDRLVATGDGRLRVARIAALTGTAGVGKTALAVHWAHLAGGGFPDGCLYVDLRGYDPEQPVIPGQALAGFLRSLGVTGADVPPTEAERAARYRTLLAERRMLVLLDNARDTEQVRPLLPGGPGCLTLVTSRDTLAGLVARHGARRLELDPLSRTEAVELLGTLLGSRVRQEPAGAAALADRCVRLPLMLRLVAELAGARSTASLAELDDELADVRQRLRRLDAGGEPRTAIHAVFSWSYQSLAPATGRVFRLFGLYPGHDLDEYAVAALAGVKLGRARLLLHDLARAHLVQPVRPHRYGMHDLLRAYAAELAAQDPEGERRAALGRLLDQQLHACATALDLIAPFSHDQRPKVADAGWPVPPLIDYETAMRWLDAERSNLIATALAIGEQEQAGHAGKLAAMLVRYLDIGAHHHDAELLYRHAADTSEPPARAHALTNLGVVCWRLGRYQEAADHHERALELAREVDDKIEQGRALLSLGIVYWHLSRTAQTLETGQQALELYRELGDRLGEARVLGNLGTVHGRLGDYPAALRYHKQALALFREIGDPAGIGNELCGLGDVLIALGRCAEAVGHLRESLDCARRSAYRELEAEALAGLGSAYLELGRLAEALDHHQQVLELTRRIGDRTIEGYALGRLGSVQQRRGQLLEATALIRQAMRLAREIGDEHLAAELLGRWGDTLRARRRPNPALRAYRRALAKSTVNGNRYQQAHAHRGIARMLTTIGVADAAGEHWNRALTLYTELGCPQAAEVRAELAGLTGTLAETRPSPPSRRAGCQDR